MSSTWDVPPLPPLVPPNSEQSPRCQRLLLTLVDWIRQYEVWIGECVGLAYREETLQPWKAKHETIVPAEEMAVAWRMLGVAIADNLEHFIPLLERHENIAETEKHKNTRTTSSPPSNRPACQ